MRYAGWGPARAPYTGLVSSGGSRPPQRSHVATSTTADLRRINLGRVLREIHLRGPVNRATLTEHLGLARGTVGVVLESLNGAGLVTERLPDRVATRGRPSPVLDVVSGRAVVLAVDLAVDAIRLSVVGLGGRILARQEWPHQHHGPEAAAKDLVGRLRSVARRHRRAGAAYQAVSVACWGIVRSPDGFINIAPNLGWNQVPLGQMLTAALAASRSGTRPLIQHVAIGNDADLGAMAEYLRGAGAGSKRLLYVHSDIGVGGGIVDAGHLLGADGGYTGEIGHMTVNPAGRRCRCGAVGCWETEVDERALLRAAGMSEPGDDSTVASVARRILDDARGGDQTASVAVAEVATALGSGLASLVHVLGPDRIVVGGYLADLVELCPDPVRMVLRERGFSPEARDMAVVPGECRDDAALLGAAEYALEPLLRDPLGELS